MRRAPAAATARNEYVAVTKSGPAAEAGRAPNHSSQRHSAPVVACVSGVALRTPTSSTTQSLSQGVCVGTQAVDERRGGGSSSIRVSPQVQRSSSSGNNKGNRTTQALLPPLAEVAAKAEDIIIEMPPKNIILRSARIPMGEAAGISTAPRPSDTNGKSCDVRLATAPPSNAAPCSSSATAQRSIHQAVGATTAATPWIPSCTKVVAPVPAMTPAILQDAVAEGSARLSRSGRTEAVQLPRQLTQSTQHQTSMVALPVSPRRPTQPSKSTSPPQQPSQLQQQQPLGVVYPHAPPHPRPSPNQGCSGRRSGRAEPQPTVYIVENAKRDHAAVGELRKGNPATPSTHVHTPLGSQSSSGAYPSIAGNSRVDIAKPPSARAAGQTEPRPLPGPDRTCVHGSSSRATATATLASPRAAPYTSLSTLPHQPYTAIGDTEVVEVDFGDLPEKPSSKRQLYAAPPPPASSSSSVNRISATEEMTSSSASSACTSRSSSVSSGGRRVLRRRRRHVSSEAGDSAQCAPRAAAAPPSQLARQPTRPEPPTMDDFDDVDGEDEDDDLFSSDDNCETQTTDSLLPASPANTLLTEASSSQAQGQPAGRPLPQHHSGVSSSADSRRPSSDANARAAAHVALRFAALPVFSAVEDKSGKSGRANATATTATATPADKTAVTAVTSAADGLIAGSVSPRTPRKKTSPPLSDDDSGRRGDRRSMNSALNRNGRYSPFRARTFSNDEDHLSTGEVSADTEKDTLLSYLNEVELNLSFSTFNSIGRTLSQSLTLRVLILKGSTVSSEGLQGLASIPTLKSLCVSHMRNLTSLVPLLTFPAKAGHGNGGIEILDAQCSPLTDEGIKGLERLRQLQRLDLGMTYVSDVSGLARCRALSELNLIGTRVNNEGLAGLEKLSTLLSLNVARTKVTSLNQLARSQSLQTLVAYSCQIGDEGIVNVGDMPHLITLDVSTTKISDLSVLQSSYSLKSLRAQWLGLKNCRDIVRERRAQMSGVNVVSPKSASRDAEVGFAGLACIPTLETVDLSFNTLHSFHALCNSTSLKHLVLRRTRVDNGGVGSIGKLADTLESIAITNLLDNEGDDNSGCSGTLLSGANGLLSTIGEVHKLRRLSSIDFSYTDVFDLRKLQKLRHLRELIIVETLVTVDGLRGIEKIPTLETLDISQTSIVTLQFLVGGAPALKKILMKSNRNERGVRLGSIHQLPALEYLDLSDTVVEDVEAALATPWNLKTLVWRWSERRDNHGAVPALKCCVRSKRLLGMRALPCLTTLDLTNTSIDNLTFLERSPSIKNVTLHCCRHLSDATITALGTLAALEVLMLTDNPYISDVRCLRSCLRLREVYLHHTRVTRAGLGGVTTLPELKVLDITNTSAEEDEMEDNAKSAVERSYLLDDSSLRDGSAVLEGSAAPVQFRVPRRRRVSFVAHEGGEAAPTSPS